MSAPLPLPRRPHLPGSGSEPDREPLERAKALVPPAFPDGVPADDPAFRYGLRLHESGFFWEAHEVWEAVWKAAPKNGRDRLVLRGLIQLANAQLKLKRGRRAAALRVLDDAAEHFAEAATRDASDRGLMAVIEIGAFLAELRAARQEVEGDPPSPMRVSACGEGRVGQSPTEGGGRVCVPLRRPRLPRRDSS